MAALPEPAAPSEEISREKRQKIMNSLKRWANEHATMTSIAVILTQNDRMLASYAASLPKNAIAQMIQNSNESTGDLIARVVAALQDNVAKDYLQAAVEFYSLLQIDHAIEDADRQSGESEENLFGFVITTQELLIEHIATAAALLGAVAADTRFEPTNADTLLALHTILMRSGGKNKYQAFLAILKEAEEKGEFSAAAIQGTTHQLIIQFYKNANDIAEVISTFFQEDFFAEMQHHINIVLAQAVIISAIDPDDLVDAIETAWLQSASEAIMQFEGFALKLTKSLDGEVRAWKGRRKNRERTMKRAKGKEEKAKKKEAKRRSRVGQIVVWGEAHAALVSLSIDEMQGSEKWRESRKQKQRMKATILKYVRPRFNSVVPALRANVKTDYRSAIGTRFKGAPFLHEKRTVNFLLQTKNLLVAQNAIFEKLMMHFAGALYDSEKEGGVNTTKEWFRDAFGELTQRESLADWTMQSNQGGRIIEQVDPLIKILMAFNANSVELASAFDQFTRNEDTYLPLFQKYEMVVLKRTILIRAPITPASGAGLRRMGSIADAIGAIARQLTNDLDRIAKEREK